MRNLSRRQGALTFGSMVLLLAACFLMGGASRTDVMSLIVLQPLAVLCIAIVFLVDFHSIRWRAIRTPLALLGVLAGIMVVQLIPLPPAVWTNLPGHAQFAAIATVGGIEQPWRPISLSPDLTLAGLASLSVPAAVLIGYGALPVARTRDLLPIVIGGAVLSAVLGLAQLSGGTGSPLYLYDVTSRGLPVGLFANRNHQALLLTLVWPMLAVWLSFPTIEPRFRALAAWVSGALAIFILPMLLATGSRAGLLLGALTFAAAIWFLRKREGDRPQGRFGRWLAPAAALAGLGVFVAAVFLSRDEAIQRATGMDLAEERRFEFLPTLIKIAGDFFPTGAGFGSFDRLYRVYEPLEFLSPNYLNHAHNDLLELIIDGGLPAALLAIAFAWWIVSRARVAFLRAGGRPSEALARLAVVVIVILFLGSLVDYPLRTPLLAAICAIACGWLTDVDRSTRVRSETTEPGDVIERRAG